ncbi:MAG TPA: antitoxin, Phd family protein [Deltaproteobacteria bacterium]|nr:MAG: hypothetical protein A2048_08855 [Deltaproteobacteria bacterium GWA2_45_12]HBF12692.1 antitoxin, Phd family protein [Deltaproteobacteria bacterium]
MKPSENIKPITYLKTSSAKLVKQVHSQKSPVIITQNGQAKLVIQDVKTYEKTQEMLTLLKILSQGVSDIQAKKKVGHETLMRRLRAKIKKKIT